jgi:DTW domain-containing protein YfiP
MCERCARPTRVCVCAHVTPLVTQTRVVLLQHPREADVPIGTAKLAELGLPNSRRFVGVDFASDREAVAALSDPEAPAILLYPSPDALPLSEIPKGARVTLVVVDGTWWQAQKLLKLNPLLRSLPHYVLSPSTPSRYRIRREPAEHCVSTIEAVARALSELEADSGEVERVLAPFDAMVEHQLAFASRKSRRHAEKRPRAPQAPPSLSAIAARRGDLVIAYGEANAWPKGTPLGSTPEMVHFAAERFASGERFEAFVRPRLPLSPSFEHHTGLDAARAFAGESVEAFKLRLAAFLRPDDLLVTWGHYAVEVLRRDGVELPEHVDLRKAARDQLKQSPGDVVACAARLSRAPEAAWVDGRTGRRLAGLSAVTSALVERAELLAKLAV